MTAKGTIVGKMPTPQEMPAGVTVEELARLWAKIDKRGPDECWLWTAAVTGAGTPVICWGGRNCTAARVVYELETGVPVLRGQKLSRSCMEIRCVNPAHRYIGKSPVSHRMPEGSRFVDATERMLSSFWAKIDKRGSDECWPWTGSCSPAPNVKWGSGLVSALRVMWELEKKTAVPKGVQVRRTCGCSVCINPAHLVLFGRDRNIAECEGRLNIFDLAWMAGFDLVMLDGGGYRAVKIEPGMATTAWRIGGAEVNYGGEDVSGVAR